MDHFGAVDLWIGLAVRWNAKHSQPRLSGVPNYERRPQIRVRTALILDQPDVSASLPWSHPMQGTYRFKSFESLVRGRSRSSVGLAPS